MYPRSTSETLTPPEEDPENNKCLICFNEIRLTKSRRTSSPKCSRYVYDICFKYLHSAITKEISVNKSNFSYENEDCRSLCQKCLSSAADLVDLNEQMEFFHKSITESTLLFSLEILNRRRTINQNYETYEKDKNKILEFDVSVFPDCDFGSPVNNPFPSQESQSQGGPSSGINGAKDKNLFIVPVSHALPSDMKIESNWADFDDCDDDAVSLLELTADEIFAPSDSSENYLPSGNQLEYEDIQKYQVSNMLGPTAELNEFYNAVQDDDETGPHKRLRQKKQFPEEENYKLDFKKRKYKKRKFKFIPHATKAAKEKQNLRNTPMLFHRKVRRGRPRKVEIGAGHPLTAKLDKNNCETQLGDYGCMKQGPNALSKVGRGRPRKIKSTSQEKLNTNFKLKKTSSQSRSPSTFASALPKEPGLNKEDFKEDEPRLNSQIEGPGLGASILIPRLKLKLANTLTRHNSVVRRKAGRPRKVESTNHMKLNKQTELKPLDYTSSTPNADATKSLMIDSTSDELSRLSRKIKLPRKASTPQSQSYFATTRRRQEQESETTADKVSRELRFNYAVGKVMKKLNSSFTPRRGRPKKSVEHPPELQLERSSKRHSELSRTSTDTGEQALPNESVTLETSPKVHIIVDRNMVFGLRNTKNVCYSPLRSKIKSLKKKSGVNPDNASFLRKYAIRKEKGSKITQKFEKDCNTNNEPKVSHDAVMRKRGRPKGKFSKIKDKNTPTTVIVKDSPIRPLRSKTYVGKAIDPNLTEDKMLTDEQCVETPQCKPGRPTRYSLGPVSSVPKAEPAIPATSSLKTTKDDIKENIENQPTSAVNEIPLPRKRGRPPKLSAVANPKREIRRPIRKYRKAIFKYGLRAQKSAADGKLTSDIGPPTLPSSLTSKENGSAIASSSNFQLPLKRINVPRYAKRIIIKKQPNDIKLEANASKNNASHSVSEIQSYSTAVTTTKQPIDLCSEIKVVLEKLDLKNLPKDIVFKESEEEKLDHVPPKIRKNSAEKPKFDPVLPEIREKSVENCKLDPVLPKIREKSVEKTKLDQVSPEKEVASLPKPAKKFVCDICAKEFTHSSTFLIHKNIHNNEKRFQCPICKKCFALSTSLDGHLLTHEKDRRSTCKKCGKECQDEQKSEMLQNMAIASKNKHFCKFCTREFKSPSEAWIHKRSHKGRKPYECLKCPKTFTREYHLATHQMASHFSDKTLTCEECKNKPPEIQNGDMLERIPPIGKGGKYSLRCDICHEGFQFAFQVLYHKRIHDAEKRVKVFKCSICPKIFTKPTSLTTHNMKHHAKKKSFGCYICHKAFYQASNLIKHKLAVHKKRKTFECTMCDNKKFTLAQNLTRHQSVVHKMEKQFNCKRCQQKFPGRSELMLHKRVHSASKPYKCKKCNYTTVRLGNLKAHCRATHS